MPGCTCEHPLDHSNPRYAGTCMKCGRLLRPPEPPPKRVVRCARCNDPVDLHGTYVLGFHKSIQPMVWRHLCPDCTADLRTWLRLVPL